MRLRPAGTWAAAVLVAGLPGACSHSRPPAARPTTAVEPVLTSRPATSFDGRLRLATVFPTLGRYATSGLESQKGALLAVEDLNAKGGIRGRLLQLEEYGTGSYFVDARAAAELATTEGGAVAVVGANSSSLSEAIANVCEARGVPQVSNVSTARSLTWGPEAGPGRRFVFRMCATDVALGRRMAAFAWETLHARRAAALYELSRTYSSSLAQSFLDEFARRGGPGSTTGFFYLPLETDFRPHLRRAQAFHPDVIFVPGSFTDATLVARQAERLGIRTPLLGGDGWSSRLLFSAGGPAGPAWYGDLCEVPTDFLRRFAARFGGEPPRCRALLAYDAVMGIAAALKGLGTLSPDELTTGLPRTRDRLRAALDEVDAPGAGGRIRFDEHGDAVRGVTVMRVVRTESGWAARPASPGAGEP